MERDADAAPAQPNGRRPSNQLHINKEGRKPLLLGTSKDEPKKKEELPPANPRRLRPGGAADTAHSWRAASGPAPLERRGSNKSPASLKSPTSPGTRLPQPKGSTSARRKPLSIGEAMKRAEIEEGSDTSFAGEGSPSPAPRAWHARAGSDGKKMRKLLEADHLDTKGRNRPSLENTAAGEGTRRPSETGETSRGLFGKSRTATKSLDIGRELSRAIGNESNWRNGPRDWASGRQMSKDNLLGSDIPDLVPGIEDVPLPSVEGQRDGLSSPLRQAFGNVEIPSPEKSYAWQIDQDFTAGDLQVSDSPRIKVGVTPFANRLPINGNSDIDINSQARLNPGTQNTKLDEIRSREARIEKPLDEPQTQRQSPRLNTVIDDIRERERRAENEIEIPDRKLSGRQNTKLDEIKQLESTPHSNRAKANARLSEMREQNSVTRSTSRDETRPHSSHAAQATPITKIPVRSKSAFEAGGERIPDTPVTVYKNRRDRPDTSDRDEAQSKGRRSSDSQRPDDIHKRSDSRSVLRQLARTASSSPAPEIEGRGPPTLLNSEKTVTERSESRARNNGRKTSNGRKITNPESKEPATRRTVGFAGLRRMSSSESSKSKRSSMHSEADPTERLVGEAALFALPDNNSERGSIRAPSPWEDMDKDEYDEVEATPKPKRQDPLSMPTPRVTGAYVETPATVKVEKLDFDKVEGMVDKREEKEREDQKSEETKPLRLDDAKLPVIRVDTTSLRRHRDSDTASDPGTADTEKDDPMAPPPAATRPRARSLPRRRPPLRNSAKPPSVKDDLKELQRAHNIDDSTLEDLDQTFPHRKETSPLIMASPDLPLLSAESLSNDANMLHVFDSEGDANLQRLALVETSLRNAKYSVGKITRIISQQGAQTPQDGDAPPGEESISPPAVKQVKKNNELETSEEEADWFARQLNDLAHGESKLRINRSNFGLHPGDTKSTPTPAVKQVQKSAELETSEERAKRFARSINQLVDGERKLRIDRYNMSILPSDCPIKDTSFPQAMAVAKPKHTHTLNDYAAPGSSTVTYIHLPFPRLFHTAPHFRLTLLGLLVVVLSFWGAAESAMCAAYCRPDTCSSPPCIWSFDDPSFGTALPVKIDQWTTGGYGREKANVFIEDVEDWVADRLDDVQGREITDVDISTLSFYQKRQHRRRLHKKGLVKVHQELPEQRAKWDSWRQTRLAKERAKEAHAMGYVVNEQTEESLGGDERIW